jgi:hypothetical protein
MTSKTLYVGAAVLMVFGLAGCSGNSDSGGSVATKQAEVNSKPGMSSGGPAPAAANTPAPPTSGGAKSGAQN